MPDRDIGGQSVAFPLGWSFMEDQFYYVDQDDFNLYCCAYDIRTEAFGPKWKCMERVSSCFNLNNRGLWFYEIIDWNTTLIKLHDLRGELINVVKIDGSWEDIRYIYDDKIYVLKKAAKKNDRMCLEQTQLLEYSILTGEVRSVLDFDAIEKAYYLRIEKYCEGDLKEQIYERYGTEVEAVGVNGHRIYLCLRMDYAVDCLVFANLHTGQFVIPDYEDLKRQGYDMSKKLVRFNLASNTIWVAKQEGEWVEMKLDTEGKLVELEDGRCWKDLSNDIGFFDGDTCLDRGSYQLSVAMRNKDGEAIAWYWNDYNRVGVIRGVVGSSDRKYIGRQINSRLVKASINNQRNPFRPIMI